MHLWARVPSFLRDQSGDTEATDPNLIMPPKIRQYHGSLLAYSSAVAQIPCPLPLRLDTLHPPIAGKAIGG